MFPPELPGETVPVSLVKDGIAFFKTWLQRIGGIVAFAGAIKFAIAARTEDEKEIMLAVLTMASGFMISEAVGNLNVFSLAGSGDDEFQALLLFIGKWTGRVGALGLFAGSVQFGLAIRDNNAGTKVTALKGMTAGAMVIAISGIIHTFA